MTETAVLAEAVARVVAMTADLVETARIALDRALETDVAATASAMELRVLAAAALCAEDVALRLDRTTQRS